MGCVYRAEHVKLGRDVALKLLREDYAQRRDAVTRFFQEARAVNLIRHRNIVDVIDYVELDEGTVFIIMELLAGHSLGRLMRGPIELGRAIGILAQICDGLAAAHAVGIVHRDLKPDNIIVVRSPDGGDLVKILDFGVAKLVDKYASDPELTAVGSVIGTPAYMSPEQAGGLAVDPRADVYALGAIMYELFTQQPVFRAGTFGEFVRRHLNQKPVAPSKQPGCEHMDRGLEAVIVRCLEKSPDARFQSALELRGALLDLPGQKDLHRTTDRQPAPPLLSAVETPVPAPQRSTGAMKSGAPAPTPTPPPSAQSHEDGDTDEDSDADEATIEVPRGSALGALSLGAAPPPPRESALRRSAIGRVSDRMQQADPPWTSQAGGDRAAPVAYGTPSPYEPGEGERRSVPRMSARRPVPSLSGPMSAMSVADPSRTAGPFDAVLGPRPRSRGRVLVIAGAGLAVAAAGFALTVPFLGRDSGDAATPPARSEPRAQSDLAAGRPAEARAGQPSPSASRTQPESGPVVTPGTPDEAHADDEARKSGADAERTRTRGDQRSAPSRAPAPIRVRVVSHPAGELHAAGRKGAALCETPCALTINPRDGGDTERRFYIIKRPGYKDELISIELTAPPKRLRVELEKLQSDDSEDPGGESESDSVTDPEISERPVPDKKGAGDSDQDEGDEGESERGAAGESKGSAGEGTEPSGDDSDTSTPAGESAPPGE
jgi:serine/threonine protein kinase